MSVCGLRESLAGSAPVNGMYRPKPDNNNLSAVCVLPLLTCQSDPTAIRLWEECVFMGKAQDGIPQVSLPPKTEPLSFIPSEIPSTSPCSFLLLNTSSLIDSCLPQ